MNSRRAAGLLALLFSLLAAPACRAGMLRYCDEPTQLSAAQKDKLLRFGAIVKAELDKSAQSLALVARSGLDLSRFGVRYSHAGFSLKASANAPWSVRQLYYACDERRPRLYDQGMPGFILGGSDPTVGYISLVFLPEPESAALEQAALDNRRALQLLGATYSANAYAYAQRYQNCNQWVAELLASAWAPPAESEPVPDAAQNPRVAAQRWLKAQGYEPTRFDVNSRALMFFGAFVPYLHNDDHPPEDIAQMTYRVSMPAAIEAFVQNTLPGASRLELCHTARYTVIHHGWEPIADGCQPGALDEVVPFD